VRIGLDATQAGIAGGERGGVYMYLLHLLRHLGALTPESRYRLLFALPRRRHTPAIRAFLAAVGRANVTAARCRVPARWLRRTGFPVDPWMGSLDVFHAPAHLAVPCWRAPVVVTVHDLAYLRDRGGVEPPAGLSPEGRRRWEVRRRFFAELTAQTERTLRDARLVIAVSRATRDDLVTRLGVPASKIRVVHNGLRDDLDVGPQGDPRAHGRLRDGLDQAYGLYVGVLDPNKNLDTLLEGFARFRARGGRLSLAIVGNPGWYGAVLESHVRRLGLGGAVRFLGYVHDADLPGLYAGARWLAMPSPLEGFGMPALEAMACGTPVIAAHAGALPEVVGHAGLLVDPDSPEAFAEGMSALGEDEDLRTSLSEAGRARAKEFSWERAARETLAVYTEARGGGPLPC